MKRFVKLILALLLVFPGGAFAKGKLPDKVTISLKELENKIKGGWAGQTIGVTFGGPTEFKYLGRIIPDYVEIPWNDNYVKWYYDTYPGLYDDIYMNLTFVDVLELPDTLHRLEAKWLNPQEGVDIILENTIIYSDRPLKKQEHK